MVRTLTSSLMLRTRSLIEPFLHFHARPDYILLTISEDRLFESLDPTGHHSIVVEPSSSALSVKRLGCVRGTSILGLPILEIFMVCDFSRRIRTCRFQLCCSFLVSKEFPAINLSTFWACAQTRAIFLKNRLRVLFFFAEKQSRRHT